MTRTQYKMLILIAEALIYLMRKNGATEHTVSDFRKITTDAVRELRSIP